MKILLELALCSDHLLFGDKCYKQIYGLAMGNSFSPIAAIIYMSSIENIILDKYNGDIKWVRYIDDIFFVIYNNVVNENELLIEANTLNNTIKFTLETATNGEMSFLDIWIKYFNNAFHFHLYIKKIHSGVILPYDSFIPEYVKRGVVLGEFRRAVHRSSDNNNIIFSLQLVINRLIKNNYPVFLLHSLLSIFIKRRLNYINNNNNNDNNNDKDGNIKPIYIQIPFVNDSFTYRLTGILRKLKLQNVVRFYFRPTANFSTIFGPKQKSMQCSADCIYCPIMNNENTCYNKCLIYKVECTKCHKIYIGETKQILKSRIKQHFNDKNSAVFKHHNLTHNIDNIFDCFQVTILHKGLNNYKIRLYTEAFYISKYWGDLMNGCEGLSLTYK